MLKPCLKIVCPSRDEWDIGSKTKSVPSFGVNVKLDSYVRLMKRGNVFQSRYYANGFIYLGMPDERRRKACADAVYGIKLCLEILKSVILPIIAIEVLIRSVMTLVIGYGIAQDLRIRGIVNQVKLIISFAVKLF